MEDFLHFWRMVYGRRYFRDRRLADDIPNARPGETVDDRADHRQVQSRKAIMTSRLKHVGELILRAYQGAEAIELGIPTLNDIPLG